jgi:hypothetical protein
MILPIKQASLLTDKWGNNAGRLNGPTVSEGAMLLAERRCVTTGQRLGGEAQVSCWDALTRGLLHFSLLSILKPIKSTQGVFVSYPLKFRSIISKRILSFRSIK